MAQINELADEEVLTGGNMTEVVRVGNTVRRAAGPWTPTVHALLDHLHSRGFTQVPRAMGMDDKGREIISFLPGRVGTYPLTSEMLSDRTLTEVARTLRAYHDAAADFEISADAVWQWRSHAPVEVVCHNDFAPYNLMFEAGAITGVIDFDTASPGPRVWDMAYTAYRFVPLTDPTNSDVRFPGTQEQIRRLKLFTDSYGLASITSVMVLDNAIAKLEELIAFIVDSAAEGDSAQIAVLERGDTKIYERDINWMRTQLVGLVGVTSPG